MLSRSNVPLSARVEICSPIADGWGGGKEGVVRHHCERGDRAAVNKRLNVLNIESD